MPDDSCAPREALTYIQIWLVGPEHVALGIKKIPLPGHHEKHER